MFWIIGSLVCLIALIALIAVLGTREIDARLDCPPGRDPWEAR